MRKSEKLDAFKAQKGPKWEVLKHHLRMKLCRPRTKLRDFRRNLWQNVSLSVIALVVGREANATKCNTS